MNCFDFHCHLDHERFNGDREEVLKECLEGDVSALVTVVDAYKAESFYNTMELLEKGGDKIFCVAGAHPHNADNYTMKIEKNLVGFIEEAGAVAVGECGLDYHYNLSSRKNQERVFKRQIAIAKELHLPLVIHARDAEQEALSLLEEERFDLPVVFHCFTGKKEYAEEILKRGYCISFSGVITFKKTGYLLDIVRNTPLDKLFTETDAPYLSPVPFRGKRNIPSRVRIVAEKISEVRGIGVEELNLKVRENFERIFESNR